MKRGGPPKRFKPMPRGVKSLRSTGFKRPTVAAMIAAAAEKGLHLIRAAGLKRTGGPAKRSPEQADRQRRWNVITGTKVAAGEGCIRCGTRGNEFNRLTGDHKLPTGRGGPWTAVNQQLMCVECQNWKHGNDIEATAQGFTISGHRAVTPVASAAPSQRRTAC